MKLSGPVNSFSAAPTSFLRQQAQASLARRGITEPVTWEPPAGWICWPAWPGTDPASIPHDDVTVLLQTGGPVRDAAATLGGDR